MPESYVQGPLSGLADGCGGNESLVNPTKALHPPAFLLALALETGRKLP